MNKLIISAALAASALALPTAAFAQTAPILIVDSERVLTDCNACKSATAQLEQKQTALRSRAQTLQQEIQAEGKPLQTAVDALSGKQPGPALQQKIAAFQTKEKSAQQELQSSDQALKSTVANARSTAPPFRTGLMRSLRAAEVISEKVSIPSLLGSPTETEPLK